MRRALRLGTLLTLAWCSHVASESPPQAYEVLGKTYEVMGSSLGYREIGVASWYGTKFHGRHTSLGEIYDMNGPSAAHKSLPLPTVAKVTNLDNGKSVVVRVNDRGPFHDERVIDLSLGAAKVLGFDYRGTVPVVVEALDHVNHPELIEDAPTASTVYLQVGAFNLRRGAERRLSAVRQALSDMAESRILESASPNGVLYKVWVGPVDDDDQARLIAAAIADERLDSPWRVVVDSTRSH